MANDIALAMDSVLNQKKMRKQLNELSEIAADLKDLLAENVTILTSPVYISDNIKVFFATGEYMCVHFTNNSNRLEIGIYKDNFYKSNVVSIDTSKLDDELLEKIILRSKEEIAIFKKSFEVESILRKQKRIIELQEELKTLSDVYTS